MSAVSVVDPNRPHRACKVTGLDEGRTGMRRRGYESSMEVVEQQELTRRAGTSRGWLGGGGSASGAGLEIVKLELENKLKKKKQGVIAREQVVPAKLAVKENKKKNATRTLLKGQPSPSVSGAPGRYLCYQTEKKKTDRQRQFWDPFSSHSETPQPCFQSPC